MNPNQYILTSQTRKLDNNQSSSMAEKVPDANTVKYLGMSS
jgi:hypothetical protein